MGVFKNIKKTHTQTARPGVTTCRPYIYLFRVGIEPVTRSAAVSRSTTVPTVPSIFKPIISPLQFNNLQFAILQIPYNYLLKHYRTKISQLIRLIS